MKSSLSFNQISLKDTNPHYFQKSIENAEFDRFKKLLEEYQTNLDKNITQNEDGMVANVLMPFLKTLGFETSAKYKQEGKSEIDLVIMNNNQVEVLFEAKKKDSKDFFTPNNPNCKAIHESILYYFRERERGNSSIKFVIITDFYKFYIFKAREFEELFYKNHYFKRAFNNFNQENTLFSKTEDFYDEMNKLLDSTKLDLNGYLLDFTPIFKQKDFSFKSLKQCYKVFHKDFLLDMFSPNDANVLNERFYTELLYILGLQEVSKNGKILILPSKESLQKKGTLYYNILYHLDSKPTENEINENALEILIIWINRILFLKLLESSLISFNDDKTLAFLNKNKIDSYQKLNKLFFEILAKPHEKRIAGNLSYLPYLNSSLFTKDAKESISISELGDFELEYFSTTQIKDKSGKKMQGEVRWLEYIFAFLDSFDFGILEDNDELIKQKELISSSVLGLVFEKLNGYKEGSFYTPSFITSCMCKESLKKIVLQKFNEANQWDCKDLDSLKNRIDKLTDSKDGYKRANEIFNSIHICDPAVGSGHFLVSALNELIYLKFELGILCEVDSNGDYHRLKDIRLSLDNDEIIIHDSKNTLFAYKRAAHDNVESHKIQKALFENKRALIESSLFGVDINPNSVNICRLRLWIELLKNTYYKDFDNKDYHNLETLPNIDINIKCGNSLVSNFEINKSLLGNTRIKLQESQNIKYQINEYKKAVNLYKNTLSDKNKIAQSIQAIKDVFKNILIENSNECSKLYKNLDSFVVTYGDDVFKPKNSFNDAMIEIIREESHKARIYNNSSKQGDFALLSFSFTPTITQLEPKEIDKEGQNLLDKIYRGWETLENIRNSETFEWRFEFPEVLDDEGNFIGFDIVIGNPPYIDYRKIDKLTKTHLNKYSQIYKICKEGSIFVYFIERAKEIMSSKGSCNFINPISYLCIESGKGLREFIDANLAVIKIIDVSNFKVFAEASTYVYINHFKHIDNNLTITKFGVANDEKSLDSIAIQSIPKVKIEKFSVKLDSITSKLDNSMEILSDYCGIVCGLSVAGFRTSVSNIKTMTNAPFLESSDIYRYRFTNNKYIDKLATYYSKEKMKLFIDSENIFMARMTNTIRCCIAPLGYFGGKVNILHNFKINKKLLLGLLNSKLINYFYSKKYFASHMQGGAFGFDTVSVGNIPIPKLDSSNQSLADEIIALVDRILEIKQQDSTIDTSELESKIDTLVYRLYNLTDEEIQIIEGDK